MESRSLVRAARGAFAALGLVIPLLASAQLAKGSDVSWVTQEEAAGYKFYDSHKHATDPYVLLRNLGVNAIRLRVWVNPANGWNGAADVLAKAQRAQAQGQRILIDFHYSDTWADPGHQSKPAAWSNDSFSQLQNDVYAHTYNTLSYLKSNGIDVTWVQVGNEIAQGMLWPDGYVNGTTGWGNLALLVNQGYSAVKAVYPAAQVILHIGGGQDNNLYRWWFDNAKAAGAKWDVIGMSFYPPTSGWQTYNSQLSANMSDMVSRYGTPLMICEVGMSWNAASTAQSMINDLFSRVKAQGSYGLGVFYWEPEAYPGWNSYGMGALNKQGQFTQAMNPFLTN